MNLFSLYIHRRGIWFSLGSFSIGSHPFNLSTRQTRVFLSLIQTTNIDQSKYWLLSMGSKIYSWGQKVHKTVLEMDPPELRAVALVSYGDHTYEFITGVQKYIDFKTGQALAKPREVWILDESTRGDHYPLGIINFFYQHKPNGSFISPSDSFYQMVDYVGLISIR